MQEALIELLVHMSLDRFEGLPVPQDYREEAFMLARIMHRLRTVRASIEDTAEAALRAYEIISRLQNQQEPEDEFQPEDLDDPGEFSEEEYQALLDKLQAQMSEQDGEQGEGDPYESPEPVEYRGDFKPEMVQLLTKLQMDQSQMGEAEPMTQEELEQLLQDSAELELDAQEGDVRPEHGDVRPEHHEGSRRSPAVQRPPAAATVPSCTMTMPAASWKPWNPRPSSTTNGTSAPTTTSLALVHRQGEGSWTKATPTSTTTPFATTPRCWAHIKRQFELIMPETWRKTYRLIDGEDIDLNSALEAWADLRMNVPPDEKIYWRRNRVERDVPVVFLLDMSASTAEAIDEGRHSVDDRDAPGRPGGVHGLAAPPSRGLGAPHLQAHHRPGKRESCALLINALESIGDTYGIYGFSGYGRENVEFYVIKDIEEQFNDKIKRRIDKMTPLHATRMGSGHSPRHHQAGEPGRHHQDHVPDQRRPAPGPGYSREGVEKEYAVHDTHHGLAGGQTARRSTPFCLTVDKAGHDYLKTMCGDLNYEVLDDIWALPERLPMLYRSLTM